MGASPPACLNAERLASGPAAEKQVGIELAELRGKRWQPLEPAACVAIGDLQIASVGEAQLAQALNESDGLRFLQAVDRAEPAEPTNALGGLAASPSGHRQRRGKGDEGAAGERSHGTSLADGGKMISLRQNPCWHARRWKSSGPPVQVTVSRPF
jgi:hypothetical protein